ncbi:LuxR C-terminal-related transcriptional regulator [Streptomyces sp. URMC 123]|uniref:helix-turn-helix transcriptional regulator n=1 Tax=Streptomyces sp. URMC 123 TaxID=3423403 RepID=UPI003F1C23C1
MSSEPSDDAMTGSAAVREAAPTWRPAGAGPALRGFAERLADLSRLALEEADRVADQAASPGSPGASTITYLQGITEINDAIAAALDRAHGEILTAQPDGPRPSSVLEGALAAVRRQITGGVAMRTLYQHSTRFDEATKDYVRQVTEYGVQVRTLEEFFERLIVIDATIAFIPAQADRTVALAVTEPAVVRFLHDTFERSWDRARPFPFIPRHAAQAAGEVMPAIRESIRRLLVEGHSDKLIARRLGISERSLQAHVAAIKQELGARNRLHLGYLLGRDETTLVL